MATTVGFNVILLKMSLDCLNEHLNTSDGVLILNLCKSVYIDLSRLMPKNSSNYGNAGTIDDIGSLSKIEKENILNFYDTNIRFKRNFVAHTKNNIETDNDVLDYVRNCFYVVENLNQIYEILKILIDRTGVDVENFDKNLHST